MRSCVKAHQGSHLIAPAVVTHILAHNHNGGVALQLLPPEKLSPARLFVVVACRRKTSFLCAQTLTSSVAWRSASHISMGSLALYPAGEAAEAATLFLPECRVRCLEIQKSRQVGHRRAFRPATRTLGRCPVRVNAARRPGKRERESRLHRQVCQGSSPRRKQMMICCWLSLRFALCGILRL